MPKFYVSSGDLQIALESDVPKNAAIAAFNRMKISPVKSLSKITLVSEQGFDSEEESNIFLTSDLLDETDQLEGFKIGEWLE